MCLGEESESVNLAFRDSRERVRSYRIVGVLAPIKQSRIVGLGYIQKGSRSRTKCADAPFWTRLKTKVVLEEDREIFEPEYQNVNCPKCLHRRVYFDREIGYYCMSCGHELSAKEIALTLWECSPERQPMRKLGKSAKKPIAEIKELRPRKAKVEHIGHDITERKKAEQDVPDS